MKYLINLVLVAYASIVGATTTPFDTQSCDEHCNTAFGEFIGQAFLTKAYSNCNNDCIRNENNYTMVKNNDKKIFTGMKWQCVEYARRWLIENKNITFADVEYAYYLWDLKQGENINTHEYVPLLRFKNTASKKCPKIGDLLIYSTAIGVTGHVAVIVGVENDSIIIAEQNYFNRAWEDKNYARRLMLDKNAKGYYRIIDEALIGWVRFDATHHHEFP